MIETTTIERDYAAMRHAMVASQLRTNAVSDPRVVTAMDRVPRERFFAEEVGALVYRDTAVPIADGRQANPPMVTGRLLTAAQLTGAEHVLLIGAAGGYTAALLSALAGSVVAVESDAALAEQAREALGAYRDVTLAEGPLKGGWPDRAPYDVLVIDGAVEHVPDALIDQLRPGARVVTGIIDRGVTRLASGSKTGGGFGLADFADADCVVLPGFARPSGFRF